MKEVIHTYEGRAWEARVQRLLKLRYKLGEYQEIPDKHAGDFGLEGYSRDGCAFQCYAAEEPISTKDLYAKQCRKIALDIKKFIENGDHLEKIFDGVKIHRWLLVVPRFDSAQLVEYARGKAEEVRLAKLPYVAEDFHVGIVTDEDFSPEIQVLARSGGIQLDLPLLDPDSRELEEWAKKNSPFISTMERKIKNIETLANHKQRSRFRDQMIRHFIVGQNALERLKTTYPDLYEEVVKLKDEKESFLEIESLLSAGPPNKTLADTIESFTSNLEARLPGVAGKTAKTFAFEAASDWLLRCPLDFPANA